MSRASTNPFAWMPARLLALALQAESDVGVRAQRVEGRRGEVVLGLTNGASIRLLLDGADAWPVAPPPPATPARSA